jgi:hypothetical protein
MGISAVWTTTCDTCGAEVVNSRKMGDGIDDVSILHFSPIWAQGWPEGWHQLESTRPSDEFFTIHCSDECLERFRLFGSPTLPPAQK